MNAFAVRNRIAREWAMFFENYPVILGPCFAGSIPVIDFDIKSEDSFLSFIKGSSLIFMANLLGLPALSLPVGIYKGLPVSVQLISGRFSEDIDLIIDWRILGYKKDEPWNDRSNTKQERFNKEVGIKTEKFLSKEFVPYMEQLLKEYFN